MAKATTTRRALLGAISADPGLFAQRLAEYHRRFAAQETWHAANVIPAYRALDAVEEGTDEWRPAFERATELEGKFDKYVDRTSKALDKLLVTPAPDHEGLATKLEIAIKEECFELGGDYSAFAAVLLADVRRLGREG